MPPLMSEKEKERKCPDCEYCQECSKSRCRACRTGKKSGTTAELTKCFTYEEYLKWKSKKEVS